MSDLSRLQKDLGVVFNNRALLEQALVHSSYVNENPAAVSGSNERLEFLGDSVLGMAITEKLYRDFPHLSEGEMTRVRAALVCRDCLFRLAKTIGLGDYLYLGKGEEASGGRRKPANLARALEAVMAAIFLDQGLEQAKGIILRLFGPEIERLTARSIIDYKSQLQELIQARHQITPSYHVVETVGPDHVRQFTVEARIGKSVLGKGSGKSKKAAETEAARSALERLPNFTQ